jgi:hypothetical protein
MSQVTMIITSCGRFDLLELTLDSFLTLNKFPLHEIIINEDSGDRAEWHKIIDKYGDIAEIIFQEKRIGLSRSLDVLMNCVETPYVLGWEDDWISHGNPNFISEGLTVLSERPEVHQVWFRDITDHRLPLGEIYEINGIKVRKVLPWKEWIGFSWNPRLIRLSDYHRIFPNGYAEFEDEFLCNCHSSLYDYKAVSLANTVVKHIGNGRHTKDFIV